MSDEVAAQVRALDEQFQRLTGREGFGWASQPTPGSWRIAFGDGTVVTSWPQAHVYMTELVRLARDEPDNLPYPFDQPLTPEQDLRVINGWQ